MHQSEVSAFSPKSISLPGANSTPSVATTPSEVHTRSAVTCETPMNGISGCGVPGRGINFTAESRWQRKTWTAVHLPSLSISTE